MSFTKQIHILFFLWLATTATLIVGVETIVQATVKSHFQSDATVAPGLLRMHFHDCFVQGCDASILIDGPSTEKTAPPNLLLRGYEVIDDAKTQLEAASPGVVSCADIIALAGVVSCADIIALAACPGVVSCADIIALAARDSVVLTMGWGWQVPTGRKDGRISLASETSNLPGFTDSIDVQKQKFAAKGLNAQDLVTLVGGGHTIGTSACQFFSYRLYNYSNTGAPNPAINPAFIPQLQSLCPQNSDGSKRVALGSVGKFDTPFFTNLRNGRGILESDQKLCTDALTKTYVQRYLGFRGSLGLMFDVEFGKAMVKMSNIELKTGTNGEIWNVCSKIN